MVERSVGSPDGSPHGAKAPRFLTLTDVAEVLNTSSAQVYALVRRGDLVAIKIGGRGQWRVEATELEAYIQRMYAEARTFIDEHPFEDSDPDPDTGAVEPAKPESEPTHQG